MNKPVIFISLLFLLFLINARISNAQTNDAGLWLSINAEKKITPALSFNISEECRFNENISELGTFFTDAGFAYKINKMFRVSANYRFNNKRNLDDSYTTRHRFYVDFAAKKKLKPITISLRSRLQSYAESYATSDKGSAEYYLREKFSIKFDLDKKYAPYIYSEFYYSLNNPKGNYIDKMRYAAGFEYTLNRTHSFDLFYMIQKEQNVKNPETDFVIGLGYNITF
jgi:long-subunit fatty acid transport protein